MSLIYAYGFARPGETGGLVGPGGGAVGSFARDRVALLGSELAGEDEVDPWEGIVAHNRVLSSAVEQGPVVPLQPGSLLSEGECERLLAAEHDRVNDLLDRFDGRVEARVQFTYDEETILREIVAERPRLARSGAGYRERVQAGEEIAARLERKRARESPGLLAALEPHGEGTVVRDCTELTVLDASFLLPRDRVPRFEESLGEVADRHSPRMAMKYIAPLPFYSFVESPH